MGEHVKTQVGSVCRKCIFSTDQEAAAMVMVACLVLGVGLGSVISYGTVSLL